jgi:hypothetical protein
MASVTQPLTRMYGGLVGADVTFDSNTLVIASVTLFSSAGAPFPIHARVMKGVTMLFDGDLTIAQGIQTHPLSGFSMITDPESGLSPPWGVELDQL